jgi:hypothetical protein
LLVSIEKERFSPELRYEADIVTWAAEALNGSMRTPTEYRFDNTNQELLAEDGSILDKIFQDSIVHAKEMVRTNPQLRFELRRREIELDEYNDMIGMMNGILPNTMVVVSDFPPELMSSTTSVGGYNVDRKQTFLRVITRKNDGRMQMFSQTLDGSNRKALEAIYTSQGLHAEDGELLGQRIHLGLDDNQQKTLIDELTSVYDENMRLQTGLAHYAGIAGNSRNIMNTYDFVCLQKDVVALAVNEMASGEFESKRYDTIALLAERFSNYKRGIERPIQIGNMSSGGFALQQYSLATERLYYGQLARSSGKTFSGCGITMDVRNPSNELAEAGYGNKTEDGSEVYSFDSFQYCVDCQAPPDKDDSRKWCGPCGLCRDCDKKAGGKG